MLVDLAQQVVETLPQACESRVENWLALKVLQAYSLCACAGAALSAH